MQTQETLPPFDHICHMPLQHNSEPSSPERPPDPIDLGGPPNSNWLPWLSRLMPASCGSQMTLHPQPPALDVRTGHCWQSGSCSCFSSSRSFAQHRVAKASTPTAGAFNKGLNYSLLNRKTGARMLTDALPYCHTA